VADDDPQLLLFAEPCVDCAALVARLEQQGLAVTYANTFLEALWRLSDRHVTLLVVYLPATDWVRNAILTEVRRYKPSLPILALAPTLSGELETVMDRLHIARALPAGCSLARLLAAIRTELTA
jgi:hypothetical protein